MELVEGRLTVEDADDLLDRVEAIADEHGATIQVFDARYVAGRDHLEHAVRLARRAIDRGEAIARDPAVEILLYAAGRRQINRALEMGVSEGETPVVAVVVALEGDGTAVEAAAGELAAWFEPAETVESLDRGRVRSLFDIGDRELDATAGTLGGIVRERVSLLTVER